MRSSGWFWAILACFCIVGVPIDCAALTLRLEWTPSFDASVIGYKVAYGTVSGSHPNEIDVAGSATNNLVISNLSERTAYYFVVQSYNLAGTLSDPTAEVAYLPLTATCRVTTAVSPTGSPLVLTPLLPLVSGAVAPVTSTCVPGPNSSFPVGSTPLSCTVTDAVDQVSCQSVVTVLNGAGTGSVGGETAGGSGSESGAAAESGTAVLSSGSSTGSSTATTTSSVVPDVAPSIVQTAPTYELPPPPGAFGFNDHGYYRPDGGWQETRLLSANSGITRVIASGCSGGAPLYEIAPPPGSSGFSDHGYYRPDGGWTETRQLAPGSSPCAVVTSTTITSTNTSVSSASPQYTIPAPSGAYGFTDHGYYRPDGGWTETSAVTANSVVTFANAPSVGVSTGASPVGYTTAVSSGSAITTTATVAGVGTTMTTSSSTIAAAAPATVKTSSPTPVAVVAAAAPTSTIQQASLSQSRPTDSYASETRTYAAASAVRLPAAPIDPVPVNQMRSIATELDLIWKADAAADSYDVYFGDTPSPQLAIAGLQGGKVHVGGLEPGKTYYWRVVAHNAAGDASSSVWTFTTARDQQ